MAVLQDKKTNSDAKKDAHGRLLDAAEELFCERGFEGTSVRDIAASANCNIAAVNYYFGSKEKLYLEVWRRHLGTMRETRIAGIEKVMCQKGTEPNLEDLLTSYADAFVQPLFDERTGDQFIKLMAREMVDKHLPQNIFVEEMVVPVMTALQQALMRICPGLSEVKARLSILSIVGQLVHTVCAKTMLEQSNNPAVPRFDLSELVQHIVQFSAAGIRAYSEGTIE